VGSTAATGLVAPTKTVLHIEHTLASFPLIEAIVQRWPPVRVAAAMHGRLGLELAQQQPALILLHLELPDLPGLQVLQRLQENAQTRPIPVITLGEGATRALAAHLRAVGAHAHLTEPLDVAQLVALAGAILA